jgi:hypothetical protein
VALFLFVLVVPRLFVPERSAAATATGGAYRLEAPEGRAPGSAGPGSPGPDAVGAACGSAEPGGQAARGAVGQGHH